MSKEGNDDKRYWANPVVEAVIGKGAKVRLSYVHSQSLNYVHIKWIAVRQVISLGGYSFLSFLFFFFCLHICCFLSFIFLFSNLLNIACKNYNHMEMSSMRV